mgnify:CR=1 FL=1
MQNDPIERADALAAIALGDTVNQLQAKIRAIPRAPLSEALAVPEIAALIGDMLEFLRGLPPDASSSGHCNRDLRARIKQAMLGQSPLRAIGERGNG